MVSVGKKLESLAPVTLAAVAIIAQYGCQSDRGLTSAQGLPANIHVAPSELRLANDRFEAVPVPPADGPRLAPIAMNVPVRARPSKSGETIGALRVGARVARSAQPVTTVDCPAGWYAVRPVGFVCAEQNVTTDLQHPIARALQVEPDRSKPMPYQYGFLRSIAPNYLRVPSADEQLKYEMRLERHLRSWSKLSKTWDAIDIGANDVSLNGEGLASDVHLEAPAVSGDAVWQRFNSDDRVPWWLTPKRQIPNLSTFRAPEYAVIADRAKRHAGVATVGSFLAKGPSSERRFAVTTDARLIPADKIKPNSGSPFHGHSLKDIGLPIAFSRTDRVHYWKLQDGTLRMEDALGAREFVQLSGAVSELRGKRMVKTRDDRWLFSDDLWTAASPGELPRWAVKNVRWIDVGIVNQVLVLWEGARPVYATLISSGRDGLGDPTTTRSTPVGTFRIYQKFVTSTMDSNVADEEFELRDVPWVMYFKGGYALHGAYWHDDFGRARSHGCINLAPIDARYIFLWSSPQVPEHWHSVTAGAAFEDGTLVNIHP